MKNETDLDLDKGLEALDAARSYTADNGVAVTHELTGRGVGAVLSLAGGLLALLTALLGLIKGKSRPQVILAILTALLAAAAVILSLSSGSAFSAAAGAALSPLGLIGSGVTAVSAVGAAAIPAPNAKV